MAEGVYDIDYMNPYHCTVINEVPGYQAIARQSEHSIQGIVIVAKDSEFSDLSDLASSTVAFPAPHTFVATLIARASLVQGTPGHRTAFVRSHDSVYRAVSKGLFPAGGGIFRTSSELEFEVRNSSRIFWVSAPYAGHAITSHPSLPPGIRTVIQTAIVGLAKHAEGQELLAKLGMK
ncbi:phosphate/phosphite/phosphonate ABC transporter substrate-binding protein [Marinobacter sp. CA1]|nr:phosphate/phosphite/phosphonate ABC transporter substrate-binding protein [Marinobacter sp. CA1]